MFARLDDCDQQFIEDHLEIIGHLLIHTRQLDMIMSNEETVQFYKNRLVKQIRAILAEKGRA
jgi:pyruvate,water dikinase